MSVLQVNVKNLRRRQNSTITLKLDSLLKYFRDLKYFINVNQPLWLITPDNKKTDICRFIFLLFNCYFQYYHTKPQKSNLHTL